MMQEPEQMGREEREKAEREAQEDRLLTARIVFVSLAIIASVVFGLWALWPIRLYVGWVTLGFMTLMGLGFAILEFVHHLRTDTFIPLWKRRQPHVQTPTYRPYDPDNQSYARGYNGPKDEY